MTTSDQPTPQGWACSIDVETGDATAVTEDAIVALDKLLTDRGAAIAGGDGYSRYGATFNVDENDTGRGNAASAAVAALDIFNRAAYDAGLPRAQVVRLEVLTVEEQERELATPNFPELLGVAEVSELLGVSRARASELQTTAHFPDPIAVLRSGPVWARPHLEHFLETWQRRPGRPPKQPA